MIAADLTFNLLCLAVDISGIVWLQNLRKRGASWQIQSALFAVAASAVLGLAILVQSIFGFRLFATLRFLGMAAFWHLPAVLTFLALSYRRIILIAPAALLLGFYTYAYFIEPLDLRVTRYDHYSPLLKGLQRPIVIAQVSDIQTDHVSAYEERAMNTLSSLRPDVIVYTGDQVQLPLIGPLITLSRLPRKYADYYGPYGQGVLSVSRGIGMERYDAPRLRFLCRPEIRLITLHPA